MPCHASDVCDEDPSLCAQARLAQDCHALVEDKLSRHRLASASWAMQQEVFVALIVCTVIQCLLYRSVCVNHISKGFRAMFFYRISSSFLS
jgi:hypothetical protein